MTGRQREPTARSLTAEKVAYAQSWSVPEVQRAKAHITNNLGAPA
jgi:hypothetical protein